MRLPLIAANWKMNKNHQEALRFINDLKKSLSEKELESVLLALPFTSLPLAQDISFPIKLMAQNIYSDKEGAYTGEISTQMIASLKVEWVLVGHSERRTIFLENNSEVNRKLIAILDSKLKAVLCVGENKNERDKGTTFDILTEQLTIALSGLTEKQLADLVIAYEPVWAIGTGVQATPKEAQEVHLFIRNKISTILGKEFAKNVRILYGGSVNADNVTSLIEENDIDGVLVGGASLEANSFISLIKNGMNIKK